jgi:hypothetical protein
MFRGPATLMRTNPQMKWVFGGAVAACLLLLAAGLLLSGESRWIAVTVIAIATLVTYPRMLSRALKPEPVSVALYVDPNRVVHTATPVTIIEATPA